MAEKLKDTTVPNPPTADLLATVGLKPEEYAEACRKLGRLPNIVEMGIIGAMWSEHCCYKSSKIHLKTFPVTGKRVLQGPGEQAGVLDLGNDYALVFKIESHNHPSAVEPFQGAATGVGGIIRDIFAMGARPLALLDSLRFGNTYPVEAVGNPEADKAVDEQPQEAADGSGDKLNIPWGDSPVPFVCTVSWMTTMRQQLFERGPEARAAVKAIREMHTGDVHVLAYCVLPDQIQLALYLENGREEEAEAAVAALKEKLAEVVAPQTQGKPPWDSFVMLHPRHSGSELMEAIHLLEFAPVTRQKVAQVSDYKYVSQVWRYGVPWLDDETDNTEARELPYCAGVNDKQAARSRYLVNGVVEGIAHYGNCIGIPTIGGELVFDPSYTSNCLVNAMCVGIVRKDRIHKARADGPGNVAMIVGARTGRDGVQGATFSSVELAEDVAESRPAVQVGDPFMEKLLLEATLEILDMPGLVGIQDFGAAGLTCSSVEMTAKSGTGMRLDLDAVPQRAKDLSAYEMMLSESQERMMIIVEKGSEDSFREVFSRWGLTAVDCGEIIGEQRIEVLHDGAVVANLPNRPLADEGPEYDRPHEAPASWKNRHLLDDRDIAAALERINKLPVATELAGHSLPAPGSDFEDILRRLLMHPSVADKWPVYQRYDWSVRTNTLLGPQGSDAAVIRIKETGQGVAMCTDGNGRAVSLDPRIGAAQCVLEAARNIVASGAEPLGITNNLNFGNPEKPDRMWQFVESIGGIGDALRKLDLPVTGGNVSLYNESGGRGILPTPVIGMVGLLEKAEQAIPSRCTDSGLELFVLGTHHARLDASLLMYDIARLRSGMLEEPDYKQFISCMNFILHAAGEGAIRACHDVSDGGLLVALVEMLAGAQVDVAPLLAEGYDMGDHNRLATLFAEDGNRWLLAVGPERKSWIRTAALHYQVPLTPLGRSVDGRLTVSGGDEEWFGCDWDVLETCRRYGLQAALSGD
ncbi:phosphoribosylformylglycinamidine synthase subunit PurL [bacterium]|nr:phosphoribosylformylglycinamidine synthase subunit PurL [bacterium]